MTTTFERQQLAADEARDVCVKDGTPERFDSAYRELCARDGVDPDGVGPSTQTFCPACSCLRCQRARSAARLDGIRHDLADIRASRPRHGSAAIAHHAREERCAEQARDRCVAEGKPDAFARFYEEELAASA